MRQPLDTQTDEVGCSLKCWAMAILETLESDTLMRIAFELPMCCSVSG